MTTVLLLSVLGDLGGCVETPAVKAQAFSGGDRYVAMGSSFAAGPGLPSEIEGKTDRCGRSSANYAHLLARKRGFDLVDVSCGGATTANVLQPWSNLPAQIDAVSTAARLVTITIGGNDVGYIGGMIAASTCAAPGSASPCQQMPGPDERAWSAVESAMRTIVRETRRRAPEARVIFIDYLTILPEHSTCGALGLTAAQADASRAIAKRLEEVTARVAATEGAEHVRASALSRKHDACSGEPWTNGLTFKPGVGGVRFHPNAAGMLAVAGALEKLVLN